MRLGRSVRRLPRKPQHGWDKVVHVGRDLVTSYDNSRGMDFGEGRESELRVTLRIPTLIAARREC